jgi:hypothetical protein
MKPGTFAAGPPTDGIPSTAAHDGERNPNSFFVTVNLSADGSPGWSSHDFPTPALDRGARRGASSSGRFRCSQRSPPKSAVRYRRTGAKVANCS